MTRRIALAMGLLTGVLVLALAVPLVLFFRNTEAANLKLGMERDALVLATDLSALPVVTWPARLAPYQQSTGARLTVLDSAGQVVYDSEGSKVGVKFTRPELVSALNGNISAGTRYSTTLGQQLTYVAVPIHHGAEIVGALRVSMPASLVESKVRNLEWGLVAALILVLVLSVVAAWAVARLLSRPLRRLVVGARLVGADPSSRVGDVHGTPEVQAIADALDETAARLQGGIERSQAVAEEASHHLRTPLAALRLRVEALSDSATGEQHVEAEAALTEVDRLTRRIDQVLALATTEAGTQLVIVDVGRVVDRSLERWQGASSEAGVELLGSYESVTVQAAPGAVERIVDELVSNALDHANTQVTVEVFSRDGLAVLQVSDDGVGIPEAERELVFDRFVRGTTARPGGTGLGLAMVRESARADGGEALVLDTPVGTQIEVHWPIAGGVSVESGGR